MLWKTKKIKKDYTSYRSPYADKQKMLHMYLRIIDLISILLGCGDIVITDLLRTGDKWIHSLHHKHYGLAADIRVRDKPLWWYFCIVSICKAIEIANPKIRINPHWGDYGKDNQHIHIEIRI